MKISEFLKKTANFQEKKISEFKNQRKLKSANFWRKKTANFRGKNQRNLKSANFKKLFKKSAKIKISEKPLNSTRSTFSETTERSTTIEGKILIFDIIITFIFTKLALCLFTYYFKKRLFTTLALLQNLAGKNCILFELLQNPRGAGSPLKSEHNKWANP